MSSNIYENPNWTIEVRHVKGTVRNREGQEERLVDIYESCDALAAPRVQLSAQDGGADHEMRLPSVQRNPFKAASLILGLLCLLLLVGVTVLSNLYVSVIRERNQSNKTKTSQDITSSDYCQQGEENQENLRWVRFRCSCYYISTERNNWTESRTGCQSRRADLLIINNKKEQDFISSLNLTGPSWIGLQSVGAKGWQQDWMWVDRSPLTYRAWQVGVNVNPVDRAKVFTNPQGTWNYTNNGSKLWICEKQIDWRFCGDCTV